MPQQEKKTGISENGKPAERKNATSSNRSRIRVNGDELSFVIKNGADGKSVARYGVRSVLNDEHRKAKLGEQKVQKIAYFLETILSGGSVKIQDVTEAEIDLEDLKSVVTKTYTKFCFEGRAAIDFTGSIRYSSRGKDSHKYLKDQSGRRDFQ